MGCNQPLIPLLSSLSGSKRLARIRREDSEELVTAEDDLLQHADIQEAYKAGRSRTGEGDLQGNEPIDHGTCENSTVPRLGPRIQPPATVFLGDECIPRREPKRFRSKPGKLPPRRKTL
jgi:hypothetical protein